MTVGAKIKRMRLLRGLTQHELGERIGFKGATISKWETSKGSFRLHEDALKQVAMALDCTVAYLTDGKDNYPRSDTQAANEVPPDFASQSFDLELDGYVITGTFTLHIRKMKL